MNRGWRSTKLHLALITMTLVCVGWVAAGHPASLYGEACTALITAAGIHAAGSTMEKLKTASAARVDAPDVEGK